MARANIRAAWLVIRNKAVVIPKGTTLQENIQTAVALKREYNQLVEKVDQEAKQQGDLATAQAFKAAIEEL